MSKHKEHHDNKPKEDKHSGTSYQDTLKSLGIEEPLMKAESAVDENLQDELVELKEEAEKSRNQMMRAMADLENMRRIAQRDVEKAHKFGLERIIKELIPVIDSLEQGLTASLLDNGALQAIREGMELTYKMFLSVLEKFGVHQLDPIGEIFNPEFHEAISMQQQADCAPNTVIMVVQKGYTLNDRVLRPARVVVAKN